MTTTTLEKAPKAVGKNAEGVSDQIQRTLVHLLDLQLQNKQAHWNLFGPFFQSIHETLDQHHEVYQEAIDELAERMLALGRPADGRVRTVARGSGLDEFPEGRIEDREVLEILLDRVTRVAEVAREAQEFTADRDAVTEDLLLALLHELEKQAWMFRSQLKG